MLVYIVSSCPRQKCYLLVAVNMLKSALSLYIGNDLVYRANAWEKKGGYSGMKWDPHCSMAAQSIGHWERCYRWLSRICNIFPHWAMHYIAQDRTRTRNNRSFLYHWNNSIDWTFFIQVFSSFQRLKGKTLSAGTLCNKRTDILPQDLGKTRSKDKIR